MKLAANIAVGVVIALLLALGLFVMFFLQALQHATF